MRKVTAKVSRSLHSLLNQHLQLAKFIVFVRECTTGVNCLVSLTIHNIHSIGDHCWCVKSYFNISDT